MCRHGRHHWDTGACRPSSNGPFRHIVPWGWCRSVFGRSHISRFPDAAARGTSKTSLKHTGLGSSPCHPGTWAPAWICIGCSDQGCIQEGMTAFSWKRIFRPQGEWEGDSWLHGAQACIDRPRVSIRLDIDRLRAGTNRRLHPRRSLSGSTASCLLSD